MARGKNRKGKREGDRERGRERPRSVWRFGIWGGGGGCHLEHGLVESLPSANITSQSSILTIDSRFGVEPKAAAE